MMDKYIELTKEFISRVLTNNSKGVEFDTFTSEQEVNLLLDIISNIKKHINANKTG